ncbi:integrin alpha [Streptomyces sp. NPDC001833]|uniref:integrin alpha n=1 Tax=Streptomyces sp. NPDC001833 TaxID=3154658 RepID=UPI00331AB2E8
MTHDDFNNDGYRDLVVSAPGGTVSGRQGAGYVAVLHGSATSLSLAHRGPFSLSTPGVVGLAQTGDHFGQATATADLDRGGYDDLIVGTPGKDRADDLVILGNGTFDKAGVYGRATTAN